MPVLDAFKGGNHLPLLRAASQTQFTILTNRAKLAEELPPNVTVVTLGRRIGPYYYGIADRLFARAVLRAYPSSHAFWQDFDVIHLNQTLGPSLLVLKETGRPLLYALHHPVTADRDVAVRETSGFERLRWRLRYAPLISAQRKLCRGADHLMVVSETIAARAHAEYGVPPERISVVPNGVDGAVFPLAAGGEDFDVIAMGSLLHPRKGFKYLLETYRFLAAKGCRIADVGRRSDEQRALLAQISGVRAFGTVKQEELLSLLGRSKTLVSASLYEGFGLSLIEALACGKPAFAFAGGAVEEVLTPVDSSLVVPVRDTQALAARILAFVALPAAERHARAAAYRAKVLELYSLSRSAEVLQAVYFKQSHPPSVAR